MAPINVIAIMTPAPGKEDRVCIVVLAERFLGNEKQTITRSSMSIRLRMLTLTVIAAQIAHWGIDDQSARQRAECLTLHGHRG